MMIIREKPCLLSVEAAPSLSVFPVLPDSSLPLYWPHVYLSRSGILVCPDGECHVHRVTHLLLVPAWKRCRQGAKWISDAWSSLHRPCRPPWMNGPPCPCDCTPNCAVTALGPVPKIRLEMIVFSMASFCDKALRSQCVPFCDVKFVTISTISNLMPWL